MSSNIINFYQKGQFYMIYLSSCESFVVVLINNNFIVFIVPIPDEDIFPSTDIDDHKVDPGDSDYSLESNPICRSCISPVLNDGVCEICNRLF